MYFFSFFSSKITTRYFFVFFFSDTLQLICLRLFFSFLLNRLILFFCSLEENSFSLHLKTQISFLVSSLFFIFSFLFVLLKLLHLLSQFYTFFCFAKSVHFSFNFLAFFLNISMRDFQIFFTI